MTTKQELETKAAEMQAEFDAMKKQIADMDKPSEGRFVPEDGQSYWFVDDAGDVCHSMWGGFYTHIDKFRLSQGNVFRTEEEAERHLEKLKVLAELRELAGYWEPDWENSLQTKCFICYCFEERNWKVSYRNSSFTFGQIYFETQEKAENAINKLGSRLDVLK